MKANKCSVRFWADLTAFPSHHRHTQAEQLIYSVLRLRSQLPQIPWPNVTTRGEDVQDIDASGGEALYFSQGNANRRLIRCRAREHVHHPGLKRK